MLGVILLVLGFDYGLRYIGVAIGQSITGSATPLTTLIAHKGIPNWDDIAKLIEKWHPSAFVVGLPYQMDGSEQFISTAARKFAVELQRRFNLPAFTMDERLTTREAKSQIAELQVQKKNLPELDSYAAKLILESWMANQSNKK